MSFRFLARKFDGNLVSLFIYVLELLLLVLLITIDVIEYICTLCPVLVWSLCAHV